MTGDWGVSLHRPVALKAIFAASSVTGREPFVIDWWQSRTSTAPIVTTLEDNDFVFRTISSDAYQGWMLGKLVYDQGFRAVALTYVNTDYGGPRRRVPRLLRESRRHRQPSPGA